MADVVLRFVDSMTASRQVRMNLADWTVWRPQDDSRFDPPPPRRARASTMAADSAFYSASRYGDERTLDLHWWLQTATTNQAADQIQDLIIELDRPFNILEYQGPNAANPLFFRTIRLAEDLQIVYPTDGTLHDVRATIIAEPFAYGPAITAVNAVTLNRDPAQASNPTYIDVSGVIGDVETPMLVKWLNSSVVAGRESVFAVRRHGTPGNAPWLFQAEAMTQGTDTTTQVNDANFSGAGNNYSRTTFATSTMQTRLSLADIGTAGTDLRGRYHVYLRHRKNTSGDGITMQLQWGTSGGVVTTNRLFTTAATTNIVYADLGEIFIPRGRDMQFDGRSGVELPVSDVYFMAVQAARSSGAGTLDLDYLRLVPKDPLESGFGIVKWVEAPASADHWWLDADNKSLHARDSGGNVISGAPAGVAGALPYLSPNVTNRVHILYETSPTLANALTTQTITIQYYPRYIGPLRPIST